MRLLFSMATILAVALTAQSARATFITLDISSVEDSMMVFDGDSDTFSFTPDSSGNSFEIDMSTGGTGDAMGLFGHISGTYSIGAISSPSANVEVASVSGSGTLSIFDGTGGKLTGDVSWIEIKTDGTTGSVNGSGAINLTNTSYTPGSDSIDDLVDFADLPAGIAVLTFSFVPAKSLTVLTTDGTTTTTSIEGTIVNAVPEPSSLLLVTLGMFGVSGVALRRRRNWKDLAA